MSDSVLRHTEWTIGPERDAEGHFIAPTRQVQCGDCSKKSPPSTLQADTDMWALRHAGRTGHRSYGEITTAPLTANPAPSPSEEER